MNRFNPEIANIAREKIGKFFKQRREALGLTVRELAGMSDSTASQVTNFELGKQNVTINTLIAFAGCLRMGIYFEEKDTNTPAGFESPIGN